MRSRARGVAVERLIDGAVRPLRRAPGQSEIAALERFVALAMVGELRGQRPMRAVVLRHHHQPGGVLVEPVHDAGPPLAADAGEAVAAMGDQRVDQRAGPMAGGRMDHQIARLVDDDDVVVLIDDLERNRLRRGLGRLGRRHGDDDLVAGIDAMARIADRLAV